MRKTKFSHPSCVSVVKLRAAQGNTGPAREYVMERSFALRGDIFFTPQYDKKTSCPSSWLVVIDGRVEGIYEKLPGRYSGLDKYDYSGCLIIPGLTDLHIHASQYQFRGLWMDEELLDWLNNHTFPQEAMYCDPSYAEKAYRIFVDDMLKSPTTRSCIFATIHKDSSLLLCRQLEESGLISYVGKVSMDRNSPDILIEDTAEAIKSEEEYIKQVRSSFSRVYPIVTPRFIPSCSDRLSMALGELAVKYDIPLQSHLSENPGELDWVSELMPSSSSYADAYDKLGLWGRVRTIMAHCVYSYGREEELLENSNIYIAHCPDSNTNLSSGMMGARYYLERGCNIALATDVAGGASLSMFRAICDAVRISKLRWRHVDQDLKPLDFTSAFYMASKAGGSFFGSAGSFEPGCDADILVLDDSRLPTMLDGLTVAERVERYIYLNPDGSVLHKAVQGEWLF